MSLRPLKTFRQIVTPLRKINRRINLRIQIEIFEAWQRQQAAEDMALRLRADLLL
jgi:hypothetical protein